MSTRLEDMLRSSPPSRRPSAGLHDRIVGGLTGEPGAERIAPSRVVRLAPAGLVLVVAVGIAAVLWRVPTTPSDKFAGGPEIDPEPVMVIQSAMTRTLKNEASLLASDAKRVFEGFKSRLPLL
jgi:hypothetical protein